MKSMNTVKSPFLWDESDLFKLLATPQGLNRLKKIMKETEILITFDNDFGVIIFPVLQAEGDEVFDMTVLRFPRGGLKHRVAQYLPIPEMNLGSFSETIDLCLEVSRLHRKRESLAN